MNSSQINSMLARARLLTVEASIEGRQPSKELKSILAQIERLGLTFSVKGYVCRL